MRLIDADAFDNELRIQQIKYDIDGKQIGYKIFDAIRIDLNHRPTIDAAPVVHGRWEEPEPDDVYTWDKRAYAQCSVCKRKSYLGRADNYCRYCGAKMNLE